MKYYKIDIKSHFPELGRIASSAEGKNIANADEYFWAMDKGEILYNAPIFDYFVLESFDKEKYWEWALFDVHDFIGTGSQIPGWFISKKLKKLLENFKISEPHFYYLSKLLYKGEKKDYYIFQFTGEKFLNPLFGHINFKDSLFFDPNQKIALKIINKEDLYFQTSRILKESGFDIINVPIKKLVLNKNIDFFPMQSFLGDNIVSERLKQAIEENGITGFEFFDIDYEVIVE